jgi:SOS-response transcriptional repressor LexA
MHPETVKLMQKMVAFIKAYQVEFGTSPSQGDIGAHINRSGNAVARLVRLAEEHGAIRHKHGARRNIEVLE